MQDPIRGALLWFLNIPLELSRGDPRADQGFPGAVIRTLPLPLFPSFKTLLSLKAQLQAVSFFKLPCNGRLKKAQPPL